MMFPLSELIGHKEKDCECSLCVGVEKRGPDYREACEIKDAQRQFEIQEKLLTLGDD